MQKGNIFKFKCLSNVNVEHQADCMQTDEPLNTTIATCIHDAISGIHSDRPACGNIALLTVESKSINEQHLHESCYQPNVKFNYSYLFSIIFNLSTRLRMKNFQVKCRPCLKSRGQGRLV